VVDQPLKLVRLARPGVGSCHIRETLDDLLGLRHEAVALPIGSPVRGCSGRRSFRSATGGETTCADFHRASLSGVGMACRYQPQATTSATKGLSLRPRLQIACT